MPYATVRRVPSDCFPLPTHRLYMLEHQEVSRTPPQLSFEIYPVPMLPEMATARTGPWHEHFWSFLFQKNLTETRCCTLPWKYWPPANYASISLCLGSWKCSLFRHWLMSLGSKQTLRWPPFLLAIADELAQSDGASIFLMISRKFPALPAMPLSVPTGVLSEWERHRT